MTRPELVARVLLVTFAALATARTLGAVTWSWWLVTAPLWLPPVCAGALTLLALLCLAIAVGGHRLTQRAARRFAWLRSAR